MQSTTLHHTINHLSSRATSLDQDREFLKKGGVFTDDMIDAHIELRMAEVERTEMTPQRELRGCLLLKPVLAADAEETREI